MVADTIRFNCVVFSDLPLNADLIGLDPVRLPSDGRVPFIRKGYIVVIHSTRKAAFPMGVSAGQQLNTGRVRLAYAHVEDKDGKQLATSLYSVNLDSGVVTLANPLSLTGYAEPLYVVHRIEDMSLVTDVEISGRLQLARPCPMTTTPPTPWCRARSSSATCGRATPICSTRKPGPTNGRTTGTATSPRRSTTTPTTRSRSPTAPPCRSAGRSSSRPAPPLCWSASMWARSRWGREHRPGAHQPDNGQPIFGWITVAGGRAGRAATRCCASPLRRRRTRSG